jgi:LITAF-like zinc ribbon domain
MGRPSSPQGVATVESLGDENAPAYTPPQQEPQQPEPVVRENVQPVQQHQYIPQPVYVNAVPLGGLNMGPAPVDCPTCGHRALTKINYVAGNQTQFVLFQIAFMK